MATFQRGETIVCSITVKDSDGTLTSPATSTKITITDKQGIAVVDNQAMTNTGDATGYFHYDYGTTTALRGDYKVRYTATDGTRITIEDDSFHLE